MGNILQVPVAHQKGWSEDIDTALKVPSNTRVYTIAKVCINVVLCAFCPPTGCYVSLKRTWNQDSLSFDLLIYDVVMSPYSNVVTKSYYFLGPT